MTSSYGMRDFNFHRKVFGVCVKLRENIMSYVADHPLVIRSVNRVALKGFGNEFCEVYGLENKKHHSQVVAEVIALYSRGRLIVVGGILQVPSAEVKHRLGQRQTGVHKRHCRGNRVPRPDKATVVAHGSVRKEPELLCSEEGLRKLDLALVIVEQEADLESEDEPILGCLGSIDDLVSAGLDADTGDVSLGDNRFALIR